MKSNDKKQKIIQKAKRLNFYQEVDKVTESSQGLWKLAKWAKNKSQSAREIPKMPPLILNGQTTSTFKEKSEMLKSTFFPPPLAADLSDISGSFYFTSHIYPMIISRSEVLKSLQQLNANKAPRPDGISNKILKACAEKLSELITPLFQACITQTYHSKAFKTANTITMKKPGKKDTDYATPKGYRPIALLNILGKVMESIMGKKILYLAETYQLLPETQMGARQGKSTETALELLTEQVYMVWKQGSNKVATLLSMDVAGAFDTVSYQRLIYNL